MDVYEGILACVTWVDILSESGWVNREQLGSMEPAECKTVGFITYVDSYKVIVSATVNALDQVGDSVCLPRSVIIDIKELTGVQHASQEE